MDDEVKGKGNSANYKYRMHDPRVGRFFAVDPLFKEYAFNSPYAFSMNRIIDAVELEGKEALLVRKVYYNNKTYLLVVPDYKVEENAKAAFQIRIPAGTFEGQDKELIYFKDADKEVEKDFDYIELQQDLYDNFKIENGKIIYKGNVKGYSTGYSGNGQTNNMSDFTIGYDIDKLKYKRNVNPFNKYIELISGDVSLKYIAPASVDGLVHYEIQLKDYGIGRNAGNENYFSVKNITTGEVIISSTTVSNSQGNISFIIPSGDEFEIVITQNEEVGENDVFEFKGVEVTAKE